LSVFEGRLVQKSDGKIVLCVGGQGDYIEDEYVIAQSGESDGFCGLPRPEIRDSDNRITTPGDRLLVLFMEGCSRRPVVIQGARYAENDFLPRNFQEARYHGHDINRQAWLRRILDNSGRETGRVQAEVAGDGKATLTIGATESTTLKVSANLDGSNPTTIVIENGQVTITAHTTVQGNMHAVSPALVDGVALGFHTQLAAALTEIVSFMAAFGAPGPQCAMMIAALNVGTWKAAQLEAE